MFVLLFSSHRCQFIRWILDVAAVVLSVWLTAQPIKATPLVTLPNISILQRAANWIRSHELINGENWAAVGGEVVVDCVWIVSLHQICVCHLIQFQIHRTSNSDLLQPLNPCQTCFSSKSRRACIVPRSNQVSLPRCQTNSRPALLRSWPLLFLETAWK